MLIVTEEEKLENREVILMVIEFEVNYKTEAEEDLKYLSEILFSSSPL